MKKLVLLAGILGLGLYVSGQTKTSATTLENDFWTEVDYIGAFGTDDWTSGWANFNSQNTVYAVTTDELGNGTTTISGGTHITTSTTLDASKVYKLNGWVIVDSLCTLTIPAGTLIRGEKSSALIVKRGGKLVAEGTQSKPIIFTSNIDAGSRTNYDWGGIIICGNATNNNGSTAQYEGIADLYYGAVSGGNDADNSGTLKYVRIEHACLDFGSSKEVNALTLCAVGNGTTIDYVQTTHSGDDGFEFFGGTVNCKHIISHVTEDDDFDTDNGWSGMVQFAVALRDSSVVDSDAGRGFESDNDASGSDATPLTCGTFSNVTVIGPKQCDECTDWAAKHDAAMYLRRNTALKIWNSMFVGNAKGLVIDGTKCVANAQNDLLQVKFTTLAGIAATTVCDTNSVSKAWTPSDVQTWFVGNGGAIKESIWDVELENPFSVTAPIFTVDSYITDALQYPRNKSCWTGAYITYSAAGEVYGQPKTYVQNPVGDYINVEESAELYNLLGVKVAQGQGTINVSSLPAGMYVLITNENTFVVEKK